jgi:hypothetical protein
MPHSQARNGIKFTKGLQLLNTPMSAGCDIRCCNEKINCRRTRVVHERFSQLPFRLGLFDLRAAPGVRTDRTPYAYMLAVGAAG